MNSTQSPCCSASRSNQNSSLSAVQDDSEHLKTEKSSEQKRQEILHRENMIDLPGGTFLMGTDDEEGFPDDGRVRSVR